MECPPPLEPCGSPQPQPPAEIGESLRKELDSYRRAMPLQRLINNGMEYADAHQLHAFAEAGVAWVEAAKWLADRNIGLAEKALKGGRTATARSHFFFGSACLRFGQVAIPRDTPRKAELYHRMVETFAHGARLAEHPIEKRLVAWRGGQICGWLLLPRQTGPSPLVIQFGGFDGWREEYLSGSTYLIERGLAVLLIDLPGQGETRLFHHLYMDQAVHEAVSVVIDDLANEPRVLSDRIGIWGNSMGGCVAAMAAIHDARIKACCVNGGTVSPIELVDRFPRFVEKVQALTGRDDPDLASSIVRGFDLGADLPQLMVPLLQLHSVPDQVFLLENARRIHDEAGSQDKTLVIWADGDHCIYNHSHEKHGLVGDWFAERLRSDS